MISQADYEYLKKCLLRDGKPTYYFAVRIMAATGVRISELLQIRVEDMIRGQMDLYSKGDKIRRIYFPQNVQETCLLWLQNEKRTSGSLFLNRFGNPITTNGISLRFLHFDTIWIHLSYIPMHSDIYSQKNL